MSFDAHGNYTGHHYMVIPADMLEGFKRWAEQGVPPGDFLCALLRNDFKEACGRADDNNARILPAYAVYMENELPAQSQGSPERFRQWATQHRLAAAFTTGERVTYVPNHANGDYLHADCERGIVSSVRYGTVFVTYLNRDGTLQTIAKATYPQDLVRTAWIEQQEAGRTC